MDIAEEFPFGIGQMVESKSNIKGFRGAWFRSEIRSIQIRRGEIWCSMQYIDFPDEKANFMKAYQQDPSGKKKRLLMVRPSYPLISMGVDESMIEHLAGPVVIVNGDWWVGDLVDWFTDGCFWAAKITAITSKDFVQVELPSAPFGEGGSYEAAVKDIRPSLEWSMDRLWTVPSIKFPPPTSKVHSMDVPSSSFRSPAKNLEKLDKEHVYIAKQEPGKIPIVRDSNNTLISHDLSKHVTRKSELVGSEFDNAKDSHVRCTSSWHEHAVTGISLEPSQVKPVKDGTMATLDIQKNGTPNYVRAVSLGRDQLLSNSYGEQEQGTSTCSSQEQTNQVQIKVTDAFEALQKSPQKINHVDLDGKTRVEQKTLGKSDANTSDNDVREALLFEEFHASLEDGKHLDLGDEKIGSSIVALEELISRVAWLKGVMQLGLKGWCRERRKRKWIFCEREGQTAKSENDVEGLGSDPNDLLSES